MDDDAKERLIQVNSAVAHAAKIAGRDAETVALIAVSKTKSADEIRPLIAAGHKLFGENRVQEAQEKWPALKDQHPGIELHLIGQLQSNKAEEAVALFDVIHSVDRPSVIAALHKAQAKLGLHLRYFLQVNIGEEDQKGGCAPSTIGAMLQKARDEAGLNIVGLMTVPPANVEPAPYFAFLAKLARDHGLAELSIGMSGDFETAIMLGATHIRVGTALFGSRV